MTRNPLVRVEAACASAVERAFALAFPSALEPVQIARKLVAAFEAGAAPEPRSGRRFTVRLSPSDYVRFRAELPYLEGRWSAMLARLAERSRAPQRAPEVATAPDPALVAGTLAIVTEMLVAPERLVLRVRKGVPANTSVRLDRAFVVGRDPACEFVLADPRVSRRHLAITIDGEIRFRDNGSSNGTSLNGVRAAQGTLACGDVLRLGDSELVVDAEPAK